ncbi:uncharacterized protein LOC128551929 [Mercenaria mercenaria]|uniref:uncharacterized protein LOC128551929 n=1 Tax=Mercenaria mercenaria TaxID=6596 RepID=UPI00234F7723|nr:uncharacterized protein LOC128551929 [Mercenaria mercenaria]
MLFLKFVCLFYVLQIPHISGAEVRLVGGRTPYMGRLEVRNSNKGQWGTVCDDQFDKKEAAVVCRMLGFRNTKYAVNISSSKYGKGIGPIHLDDLKCAGNETDILQCEPNTWGASNCDHEEDVGVNCQTPLRLAGGATAHSGRLEIQNNASWQTYCYDNFDEKTGNVICRMLGFSTGNVEIKSTNGLENADDLFAKQLSCNGTENDLTQCKWLEHSCTNKTIVEINCRTNIRLKDGPHNQSGRVEVYFEDRWGTLCDEFFDDNAASVICRMLGYNPKFAKGYGRSRYGGGVGDIIVDSLRCSGSETDISECKSKQWGSHTLCNRNETASVKCATQLRLADGPTSFSGRLEIKSSGVWNTICDEDFNLNAARIVCKMLGFERGNVSIHNGAYYGKGLYDIVDYGLKCNGNESDIADCIHTTKANHCNHSRDVGVNCYSKTPVRLVGGPTPYSGRVEVYSQEQAIWKGVCLDNFTTNGAVVLCTMIGKPNRNPTVHNATNLYNYTIRGDAVTHLMCAGQERDITDCRSKQQWNDSSCSYPNYAGINCEPVTPIRLIDGPSIKAGRVEVLFNGTWGSVCSSGLTSNDTSVMCRMLGNSGLSYVLKDDEYLQQNANITISDLNCNGGENDISDCKATQWQQADCSSNRAVGIACKSAIRLTNGSDERSGRVEIQKNGTWWTICADSFDTNAANVTCRMAGFRFWNASVLSNSVFGLGSGYTLIHNISCRGDEEDLASCVSSPWNKTKCRSHQVATVHCRVQKTPLHLVNGDTPYSGRVEVFHNNNWGTVCEKGFTKADAEVVCQTTGHYVSTDLAIVIDKYDSGYTPYNVMIRNLTCIGNESDISLCSSSDWDSGYENCPYSGSYQSVGVNCLTPIRLVGGRTKYMGRVEVTHNGRSGSVCNENFTDENAKIICSMLGYNFTNVYIWQNETFKTKSTTPPALVGGLKCIGNEKDIQQCASEEWDQANCSQMDAVAVNCNTPVKLISGPNWRSGLVKTFIYGNWTGMCYTGDELDKLNAKVVCRMMGLSTSNITVSKRSGGNQMHANVTCNGTEDDISQCKNQHCICLSRKLLAITCDSSIQLLYGRTDYMGVVSVQLHDIYGAIQSIEDDMTAGVICRSLGYNFTRNSKVQSSNDFRINRCRTNNILRLVCEGNETDVMDCKNSYWDNGGSCQYPTSGVNCQTPIRLANGSKYQHGRVEIKQNGNWYPVCSTDFTLQDAYVVCRMLGHRHFKDAKLVQSGAKESGNYVKGNLQCNGSEVDISQCSYDEKVSPCPSGKPAYIDCKTSVRLVGGPTLYKGRPEIFTDGKWGPICANSNSYTYAVLCKMLGFNDVGAISHNGDRYSNKTFDSLEYPVTGLMCNSYGIEDDISECKSNEWNSVSNCYYNNPLEIECNTPVSLQGGSNRNIGWVRVNNRNTIRGICGDNFTLDNADVICRKIGSETYGNATIYYGNKFGSNYNPIVGLQCLGNETDLQECKSFPWTSSSRCSDSNDTVAINCRPHTPIRLNGTVSSGLVEFSNNNRWGTICNENFDVKDASVICKMLGFKIGEVGEPILTNKSDVLIRNLKCTGTENDISECGPSGSWYNYKTSCSGADQRKATVKCSNKRVRLVGGVNDYIGRVEFQFIGIWGTVCDDHFDANDTEVVCRQIGLQEKNATIYNNSRFGKMNSALTVDDLQCKGDENDLDECGSYPWKVHSSRSCVSYHRDVGVNCRPKTPIRLVPGKYKGRLEVMYRGKYGTVCDRDFDLLDAQVVCRTLGHNTMSVGFKNHAFYGKGTGDIVISNLQCSGTEPDISNCNTPYRWASPHAFCKHDNDVSVQCDTPVRLRGGWTAYDGLVEVYINGSWKAVCRHGFSQKDAKAICSITELRKDYDSRKNISIHDGRFYGLESNFVSLSSLGCNGKEDDLFACGSAEWTKAIKSCNTQDNVAVNCRPETYIRLVNKTGSKINLEGRGKHAVSGRIELFYKHSWGTICDDQFDESDALVLCRMLGFTVGKVYRTNGADGMGQGNGSILIDDLNCIGTEDDISECRSREWGVHNCEHSEDVAITCDYIENIDPCKPKENIRLPNLEVRYANIHTAELQRRYNDSKLPLRWYNVGNNTFPEKAQLDHCGTHFPIYSKDQVPDQIDPVTIKATQVGNSSVNYEILAKHCSNGDYVYRLGPTHNDQSGYCFGIGSKEPPPNFVAKKVSVILKANNETVSFQCKFELPDKNGSHLFYQVQWIITGNYDAILTKQYYDRTRLDELDLTDKDFEDNNIGLGVNITCAVRAFKKPKGQPGPLSSFSKPYFAGFIIRNPEISLRKGETKAIEVVNRVPLFCPGFPDFICNVQLQHMIPNDDKCSSKGSFSERSCVTILSKDSYNNVSTVKITTSETGQYGVYGHFKVNLVYNPNNVLPIGLPKIWQKRYKLPTVNVEVFPEEDRSWRKTICSARNDPHMQTFDNTRYEHHANEGEYILYRHVNFKNVEIQHKIASCTGLTSPAKCNCGVAVRAGGDVYVINVCDRLLDIGYKRCGDKALTVKKDNDFTYTIYLPYGTAVRARIDNQPWMGMEGGKILDITVLPSVHDNANSTGLCGSLNKNGTDDFKHRYHGSILSNETVNVFINSWKATSEESLFSSSNVQKMQLDRWVFPSCMCQHESIKAHAITTCDRSVAECTPGAQTGEHSCGGLSSARTRRSVSRRPNIPIVRQTSHYSKVRQHHLKKRNSESEGDGIVWTQASAEKHCNDYFDSLKAFDLCSKLPATHTHISVANCALDIQLTNNTEWTSISRQSMQDTCTTEIHRNASVRQQVFAEVTKVTNTSSPTLAKNTNATTPSQVEIQEIEHIEKLVQEIKEITCLNNCSGNGLCENGICKCDEHFGASDCSLDVKTAPRLVGLIDNGMCDEKDGKCTHTYVFGEVFFGSNVTCRLRKFTFGVGESVQLSDKEFNIHGRADTLIEAWCPIEHIREKRSVSRDQPSEFAFGYQVSVSNDGKNFPDDPLNLYIYDSTCQTFENKTSTEIMTFNLRVGHCFIEGSCVYNGTLNVQKTMICDTRVSNYSWTPIPTTTLAPATTHTATITRTTTKSGGAADTETFHIEIRIDITLSSAESLKDSTIHQRYSKETKTALMQYYRPILGLGLKNIIINSLESGSLKVQHAVIVQKDDFVVKALSVAVANFTRGAKLEMFGTGYSVSDVKIEDTRVGKESDKYQRLLLCESYTSLRPCEKHESCVLEKGSPTCKRTGDSVVDQGKMNKIIIISSTVGGVLMIIVFALVVTICCNRKKYKKHVENHKRTTEQNEYHDMNDTEMVQIPRAKHNYGRSRGHTADQDNQAYQRDDGDSAFANTTINSRLTSGSYHESKDGYIYYTGKN